MSTINETSTDLVDNTVRTLATSALRGQMPESEARWQIAAALLSSGVPESVANSTPGISAQLRDDLAMRLQDLVQGKALQETAGGYDLKRSASGESACGWARALARRGVLSSLRNIRLHTNRIVAVDPQLDGGDDNNLLGYAALSFHTQGIEDDYDLDGEAARDLELQAIEDDFSEAASGRRSSGRLRLVAEALREAYSFPAATRPAEFLDREWIREAIASKFDRDGITGVTREYRVEPALDAARALLASIIDWESEEQYAIDQRLLNLWSDYSAEELALLVKKPARVAQALALAAVSPAPRPSRDTMSLALRTIRLADEDADAEAFDIFTRRLLDSWVAIEAEATSDFDHRSKNNAADLIMDAAAKRMESALDWPAVAAEAAARPGHPYGQDATEVNAFIASIIATVSR